MSRNEVDLLTVVLFLPLYIAYSGWGILAAFVIGFLINCLSDRAVEKFRLGLLEERYV